MGTDLERKSRRLRALVECYEASEKARPRWFTMRLAGMALLGQIVGVLLLVAMVAGAVVLGLQVHSAVEAKSKAVAILFFATFACILGVGYAVRGLWVRVPAAQGLVIGRYDAPRMSEFIENMRRETGGPKVAEILLSPDAVAAVVGRPPFGLFGPHRHTLVLGMPLLAGLSESQMRSVLAHEFAHIRESRLPLSTWVFRSLNIWSGPAKDSILRQLLFPFAWWYAPRLEAMSAVWRRVSERRADLAAAKLVGVEDCGDAVIRSLIVAQFVDRDYWPGVMKQARESVSPPGRLVSTLVQQIASGDADRHGQHWLSRAMRDQTVHDDSHPALAARLQNIGHAAGKAATTDELATHLPAQPKDTALAALFEPAFADQALAILDHAYANIIAGQWYWHHAQAEQSHRELLHTLSEYGIELSSLSNAENEPPQPPAEFSDDAAVWSRAAKLVADIYGDAAARPWYERVLERDPASADACFALGKILLLDDDPAGVELVERGIAARPLWAIDGCELLYDFHRGAGDVEAAERVRQQAMAHVELLQKIHRAASQPPKVTQLEPHGLNEQQIARLVEQLRRLEPVEQAFFFRRTLKSMPDVPVYVLIFQSPKSWFQTQARLQQLAQEIAERLQFDQPFTVFPAGMTANLRTKLDESGAMIFSR